MTAMKTEETEEIIRETLIETETIETIVALRTTEIIKETETLIEDQGNTDKKKVPDMRRKNQLIGKESEIFPQEQLV